MCVYSNGYFWSQIIKFKQYSTILKGRKLPLIFIKDIKVSLIYIEDTSWSH